MLNAKVKTVRRWLTSAFSLQPLAFLGKAEQAHRELQRDIALASMSPDHPQWQAVLELVDEHATRETDAALAPNLTNEQRQYTAGAAATAIYLAEYLRDAKRLADERMAKRKSEG